MNGWEEVAEPSERRPSRAAAVARRLAPFVAGLVLWALGLEIAALAVLVLGTGLLLAGWVRPSSVRRVERWLLAFGHLVGTALRIVLLGLVEVLVFLPLSLLVKVLRRDLLVERRAGRPGRWMARRPAEAPVPRRPFALEVTTPTPAFRFAYAGVRIVGWVVIVLALNYGLGWLWDEWFGTHDQPVASSSAQSAEELAASPAMADDPWAPEYWAAFRSLDYEFRPFLLSRVGAIDTGGITVEGARRRSYEAPGLPEGAPEVWFLGGAALWGVGQRDDHTIPSEVARLAEAAGTPIRAVNLGQPGYTSWQSALLLEQELAVRPAPDLVVFYDGADDVAVQIERPDEDPTHYNVEGVTAALVGRDSARDQAEDWWEDYRETSVVNRLLERVEGLVGVQSAAADPPGLAERVADLHARSVDLARFVAGDHGVPILFSWQAAAGVPGDGGAYRQVTRDPDTGPAPVLDLSRVLDDAGDVYLDGVLTNERGAALVAASLWPTIDDALASPPPG